MLFQSPLVEIAIETAGLPTFLPKLPTISQFHSANLIGSFLFTTETLRAGSCHKNECLWISEKAVGGGRQEPTIALPL